MKFIITENKRVDVATKWLDKNYSNLDYKVDKEYPNKYYFMKNGEVVMSYINDTTLCVEERINDFMCETLYFSWRDNKEITCEWFEKTYGYNVDMFIAPSNMTYKDWDEYSDNKN